MTSQSADPSGTPGADGVPGALAQIRGEIGDLAQTWWAARGSDELMDTVAEAESLKSSVDALVLGGVRELEATNAVKPVGWACTQAFATMTGGHNGSGSAVVRLAQAAQTRRAPPDG